MKPTVLISACLNGEPVRYNHSAARRERWLGSIQEQCHLSSFCPEMAAGLGTPRPTLRLVKDQESGIRLQESRSGADHTERFAHAVATWIASAPTLHGFIAKGKSPSCGPLQAKLYSAKGIPFDKTDGLFVVALRQAKPFLPIEDEGRLNDPTLRHHFLERVFFQWRWNNFLAGEGASLQHFHQQHKLQYLLHDERMAKELGSLSSLGAKDKGLLEVYHTLASSCLAQPLQEKRHQRVLEKAQGFLKRQITGADKSRLKQTLNGYRAGQISLEALVLLFSFLAQRTGHSWLTQQTYWHPFPSAYGGL